MKIEVFDNIGVHRRKLQLSTAEMMYELAVKSILSSNNGEYAPEELEMLARIACPPEGIVARVDESYAVYAEGDDCSLLGFALIARRKEQYKEQYEMKTLHVRPDKREKGIGSALCGMCEETLLNLGSYYSHIDALKFSRTIEFYTSRGYVLHGVHPSYSNLFAPMVCNLERTVAKHRQSLNKRQSQAV